jgi:hypothetical protein
MQANRTFPDGLSGVPAEAKAFEFVRPVIAGVMPTTPASPESRSFPDFNQVAIRVAHRNNVIRPHARSAP